MALLPAFVIALLAAAGVAALLVALTRWRRRSRVTRRILLLEREWQTDVPAPRAQGPGAARLLAGGLGRRVASRFPEEVSALATRVDRAGLTGGMSTLELLGWKVVCGALGAAVGVWAMVRYGAVGAVLLLAAVLVGWFGIDVMLARYHAQRRRAILRDLPTVMDLLVLSLEAGMALDRALRTVVEEYHSALSDEIRRVLRDVDLGVSRGRAFEQMALRVGLDEVRSLSRAIVQSEELGVSLVTVMRTQSREVRLARRRAAETEALRAPVKMLVPLVIFILPTLFMLLLGPVALRAAAALGSVP
jgi:tight adherence protein C